MRKLLALAPRGPRPRRRRRGWLVAHFAAARARGLRRLRLPTESPTLKLLALALVALAMVGGAAAVLTLPAQPAHADGNCGNGNC